MTTAMPRPFYGEFAWAYDYLIPRPVAAECAGIAATLTRRGLAPDAVVLDAGCGTGRYALELARLGYRVTGLDRAPELLAEARGAAEATTTTAAFVLGDLLALPAAASYHAILCRGVLNDFLEDSGRDASARYEFAMRCWTRAELAARLTGAGFAAIEYAPDYAAGTDARGDRIVVTATSGAG